MYGIEIESMRDNGVEVIGPFEQDECEAWIDDIARNLTSHGYTFVTKDGSKFVSNDDVVEVRRVVMA